MLAAILSSPAWAKAVPLSITRLDCGSATIKDYSLESDAFDYPPGPRRIVDSCYLLHWSDKYMLWDTGYPASFKGRVVERPGASHTLRLTLSDQLATLGLTPADIAVVAVSHRHRDHSGQAADFPQARLVVGKREFEETAGKDDPFAPWRGTGKPLTLASADVDVFGDGSVVVLRTPGHTADHLSLLVKLSSGAVLLTGDVYHSAIARQTRGVPPGNSSRADTLASMGRLERIARHFHAKVIIPHEPADVGKLPLFPKSAR